MNLNSIYIIDDSENQRSLLRQALDSVDMDVPIFEVSTGQEAMELFVQDKYKKQFPSLIFLDINVPIVGGIEFLENFENLKTREPEYNSIVFMMFKPSADDDKKRDAYKFECVKDFIIKGRYDDVFLCEKLKSHFKNVG